MKQVGYTLCIFSLLLLVWGAYELDKKKSPYEHNFRLVKTTDGCKLYAFSEFDGQVDKTHYYVLCNGAVVDKKETIITEVGDK